MIIMKLSLLYACSFALLVANSSCGKDDDAPVQEAVAEECIVEDLHEDSCSVTYNYSEKMSLGYHNPVSDYMFFADPTAVEYNGRLYVYGTNDTQQFTDGERGASNTFEKIHSFQVVSTADMVNWTYHGVIDVKEIAPGGKGVSWAPSIVSRVEPDGETHFYMFYSSSGSGVGLLTATSPLGPWKAPFGDNDFIDYRSTAIGDCPNPFDPGAVIDDNGTPWLAFGGGVAKDGTDFYPATSRICRLADDMLSVDGDIRPIPAPYFFEASELNYIGGKWIYTYSTSWKSRTIWHLAGVDAPGACSMGYMVSEAPLQPDSWNYKGIVLRNPGYEGMEYGNNHTHLHKFNGKYYIMYHTEHYEKSIGATGGYRSVCIDPIEVNESTGAIACGSMSHSGCGQLSPIDGFSVQPASQASATYGISYEKGDAQGEMVVHATGAGQCFRVEMVNGVGAKRLRVNVRGNGTIYLREGSAKGKLLATVSFNFSDWTWCDVELNASLSKLTNLCFSFTDGDCYFREWQLE
jgi:hypothetical protein